MREASACVGQLQLQPTFIGSSTLADAGSMYSSSGYRRSTYSVTYSVTNSTFRNKLAVRGRSFAGGGGFGNCVNKKLDSVNSRNRSPTHDTSIATRFLLRRSFCSRNFQRDGEKQIG